MAHKSDFDGQPEKLLAQELYIATEVLVACVFGM